MMDIKKTIGSTTVHGAKDSDCIYIREEEK